jgi:hypothetical protein
MYPISVIRHSPEICATTTEICAACPGHQVVFINLLALLTPYRASLILQILP